MGTPVLRFNRNRTIGENRTNRPELEKNGAFQPEPPGKFPVQPKKTGTGKIRSFSTGTVRKIPGTGAFEPEPPGFSVQVWAPTGTGEPSAHTCPSKVAKIY